MPDDVTALMDVPLTKNAATITAQPVSLEDILKVISSDIESLESKILGDKKNIGYIKLNSFNENSDNQILKSIKKFENKLF